MTKDEPLENQWEKHSESEVKRIQEIQCPTKYNIFEMRNICQVNTACSETIVPKWSWWISSKKSFLLMI